MPGTGGRARPIPSTLGGSPSRGAGGARSSPGSILSLFHRAFRIRGGVWFWLRLPPPPAPGEWPGQRERDEPVLVLQGAVGNASWPRDAPLAPAIVRQVESLLQDAPPLSEAPVECEMRSVAAPPPQASKRVPWLLRRATSNLI